MAQYLIITPTYNEAKNIRVFADAVLAVLPTAHILVVDDASPDGTGQIADDMARRDPRIHVMHRAGKLGLGSAYLSAFQWALSRDYAFILQMDADLSHDPKYLTHFVEALNDGADLVLGSRNIPGGGSIGWGLHRKCLSRAGSLYSRTILGVKVRDLTGGFKAFRRSVLEAIDLSSVHSEGYAFQIEMTYRAIKLGFGIREVPIVFLERQAGQSKMSGRIIAEAIQMVWRLRFRTLTPTASSVRSART